MKRLSSKQFACARNFVKTHGSGLDQARFAFHFESGSPESVIAELAKLQNPDGGFAGLEHDITLPDSSVLATTIAFQYLREVGATADCLVVQHGIRYFLDQYDAGRKTWGFFPPEVDNYPRAMWWNYSEPEDFSANPSAEVIGYLLEYPELCPSELLQSLKALALQHLAVEPEPTEMHVLLCYQRMAGVLPPNEQVTAQAELRRRIDTVVDRDPSAWSSYGAKPLYFAPSPTSPYYDLLRDAVKVNLDYEIDQQQPDGCWVPNWSWGQYPDAWEKAAIAWKNVLTIGMLVMLKAYGRVGEEVSS